MHAKIVAEDTVCGYDNPNNGAGPLWCFGARTIARVNDTVYAVSYDVSPTEIPLCNTRWVLYRRRDGAGWERVNAGPRYDEREPCMIARFPGERLAISVNPAQEPTYTLEDGRQGWRTQPGVLLLDAATPERILSSMPLVWDHPHEFSEHSYRAFASDAGSGACFMANQVPIRHDYWHAYGYYDGDGRPLRQGLLTFPMRGCYQQVAVRNKAVYVWANSDEHEPNAAWAQYKREFTGREWDYDFRQVFFKWTPDITEVDFSETLTVFSRDDISGYVRNLDLWVDADGDAHLLFLDRTAYYAFMRDRFFPGMPITTALKYARIHKGRVADRQTLLEAVEDMQATPAKQENGEYDPVMLGSVPLWGVFHATPDGRLFILWYQSGEAAGNYICQLLPSRTTPMRLPLEKPLKHFHNANENNGHLPSCTIDLYGVPEQDSEMRYAQIALPSA